MDDNQPDDGQQDYFVPISIRVRSTSYEAAVVEAHRRMQELLGVPFVDDGDVIEGEFKEV